MLRAFDDSTSNLARSLLLIFFSKLKNMELVLFIFLLLSLYHFDDMGLLMDPIFI